MINRDDLIEIGKFNKPHGIKGELSMTLDDEAVAVDGLRCLIVDREGIPVPFFVTGLRPRSHRTLLVSLAGVTSESGAREFANAPVYGLRSEVEPMLEAAGDEDDGEGFYANDLIGCTVEADGRILGEVADIDDSTANLLMVVNRTDGEGTVLIPIAAEFFEDVDAESRHIRMTLPEGLPGI